MKTESLYSVNRVSAEKSPHKRSSRRGYAGMKIVLEKLGKVLQRKEAFRCVLKHEKGFER